MDIFKLTNDFYPVIICFFLALIYIAIDNTKIIILDCDKYQIQFGLFQLRICGKIIVYLCNLSIYTCIFVYICPVGNYRVHSHHQCPDQLDSDDNFTKTINMT